MTVTNENWTHEDHMRFGVQQGWWDEWDNVGPIKWRTALKSDFESHETMAHVMVKFKQFESVTEARKAGWNKPITVGEHIIKKRRFFLEVI